MVLPSPTNQTDRDTPVLLVAYDDEHLANTARASLGDISHQSLSAGAVASPDWPVVPEVDLPDRYARTKVVIVADSTPDPFALVRALLPLAAGCHVILTNDSPPPNRPPGLTHATPATLPAAVNAALARAADAPPPLPPAHDARILASALARTVHSKRPARRA